MRVLTVLVLATVLAAGCTNNFEQARRNQADALHEVVPPERKARVAFQREVRALLKQGQYTRLEAMADSLRTTRARLDDDYYALLAWLDAFDLGDSRRAHEPARWDAMERQIDAWRKASPGSALPEVVLAQSLANRAWEARGSGWAGSVSDSGGMEFGRNLELARIALGAAASHAPRTLEWYMVAQRVALGEGWAADTCEALFREAQAQDSLCESIYWRRAYHLFPRWYGRPGEWEAWLAKAIEPLPRDEADRIYAYACMRASDLHRNLYRETRADWIRARRGFQVTLARHPKSVVLLNEYCLHAVINEDAKTARALFTRIGPRVDLEVWRSKQTFADNHLWAQEATDPAVQSASR